MEFGEKLQQLRKQNNLTQEQLAEKLYVSRTAVSKWESGKGYPNIDSLKSISKLFQVTIDDLLSGEELISLAASENRSNMGKLLCLIYGILDLMAIAFIFLPFYGNREGNWVRAVTLPEYHDAPLEIRIVYFAVLITMSLFGIAELVIQLAENEKWQKLGKACSIILHAVAILFFAASAQPYVTIFLFLLFIIKILTMVKTIRVK